MVVDPSIRTFTGKMFNVLEPDPEKIDIIDIAHALSNQCRFTGHVARFYSVGEHSVHVGELVNPEHEMVGLLHDATEAYLVDLPSPIKRGTPLGLIFKALEGKLWTAVATRFNLPLEIPEDVHFADSVMLLTEKRDLFKADTDTVEQYRKTWVKHEGAEPALFSVEDAWLPEKAENHFLTHYYDVLGGK